MTVTGSLAMWRLAESLDVVPMPPPPVVDGLLTDWWRLPRTFGCHAARSSRVWYVVAPSPSILCDVCAVEAFFSERRCALCSRRVRLSKAMDLLYDGGAVCFLGRAHRHCVERKSR